jgi:hypothetical protein
VQPRLASLGDACAAVFAAMRNCNRRHRLLPGTGAGLAGSPWDARLAEPEQRRLNHRAAPHAERIHKRGRRVLARHERGEGAAASRPHPAAACRPVCLDGGGPAQRGRGRRVPGEHADRNDASPPGNTQPLYTDAPRRGVPARHTPRTAPWAGADCAGGEQGSRAELTAPRRSHSAGAAGEGAAGEGRGIPRRGPPLRDAAEEAEGEARGASPGGGVPAAWPADAAAAGAPRAAVLRSHAPKPAPGGLVRSGGLRSRAAAWGHGPMGGERRGAGLRALPGSREGSEEAGARGVAGGGVRHTLHRVLRAVKASRSSVGMHGGAGASASAEGAGGAAEARRAGKVAPGPARGRRGWRSRRVRVALTTGGRGRRATSRWRGWRRRRGRTATLLPGPATAPLRSLAARRRRSSLQPPPPTRGPLPPPQPHPWACSGRWRSWRRCCGGCCCSWRCPLRPRRGSQGLRCASGAKRAACCRSKRSHSSTRASSARVLSRPTTSRHAPRPRFAAAARCLPAQPTQALALRGADRLPVAWQADPASGAAPQMSVVCVHGFGASAGSFRPVLQRLADEVPARTLTHTRTHPAPRPARRGTIQAPLVYLRPRSAASP